MALEKRGGKRPGAGRPKGTTKVVHNVRPQHQLRAFEDEWRMKISKAWTQRRMPVVFGWYGRTMSNDTAIRRYLKRIVSILAKEVD